MNHINQFNSRSNPQYQHQNQELKQNFEREELQIIDIEVCQNCKEHQYCTSHDENKYNQIFNECKSYIESFIPGIIVLKNRKVKRRPTLGAFEISGNGILIYSKLKTRLWPLASAVATRVKKFKELYELGEDVSYLANIQEVKLSPYAIRPVTQQYNARNNYQQRNPQDQKFASQQQKQQGALFEEFANMVGTQNQKGEESSEQIIKMMANLQNYPTDSQIGQKEKINIADQKNTNQQQPQGMQYKNVGENKEANNQEKQAKILQKKEVNTQEKMVQKFEDQQQEQAIKLTLKGNQEHHQQQKNEEIQAPQKHNEKQQQQQQLLSEILEDVQINNEQDFHNKKEAQVPQNQNEKNQQQQLFSEILEDVQINNAQDPHKKEEVQVAQKHNEKQQQQQLFSEILEDVQINNAQDAHKKEEAQVPKHNEKQQQQQINNQQDVHKKEEAQVPQKHNEKQQQQQINNAQDPHKKEEAQVPQKHNEKQQQEQINKQQDAHKKEEMPAPTIQKFKEEENKEQFDYNSIPMINSELIQNPKGQESSEKQKKMPKQDIYEKIKPIDSQIVLEESQE